MTATRSARWHPVATRLREMASPVADCLAALVDRFKLAPATTGSGDLDFG